MDMYLKETKESLNKIQSMNSAQMEGLQENFKSERKALMEKMENLGSEMTRKEREVTSLENQREALKD